MLNDISAITKNIFNGKNPMEAGVEEIENIISQYPYFAPARLLLAKKTFDGQGSSGTAVVTAGLYVHNPLVLDRMMRSKEPSERTVIEEPQQSAEEKQTVKSG